MRKKSLFIGLIILILLASTGIVRIGVSVPKNSPKKSKIMYPNDKEEISRNETVTEIYEVYLVTGDKVYVYNTSAGLKVGSIKPADPQRKNTGYIIINEGESIYVIPKGVDLNKFDKELFNVAYLVKNKYYNKTYLPIIIKGPNLQALKSVQSKISSLFKEKVKAKIISTKLFFQSIKAHVIKLKELYIKILKLPIIKKVWLDKKVYVKLDYSVPHIRAPQVWAEGYNGSGVKIAILDTGIDYNHPFFIFPNGTKKIIANVSFVEYPPEEQTDPFDYHGHGTHCAGIAAGVPGNYSTGNSHSGVHSWYSDKGNYLDNKLYKNISLVEVSNPFLSFWTKYSIETNWDYGYVKISNDNGITWKTLDILTGESNGWVKKIYDLSSYAGKNITLMFEYITDSSVIWDGWYIDDINISNIFYDDVESGPNGWVSNGWVIQTDTFYNISGVAPGALIMSAKVLNRYGWGYGSWIINGIDWAVSQGANIISMSLGGGIGDGSDPLSMECEWAVTQGVVVVVAAGNEGDDYFTIACPGCARNVITVGASDDSDNIVWFSSRGPTIDYRIKPDVVAPGVDILSSIPGGWETMSGTSMATPHVAGLAALVIQKYNLSISLNTPKTVKNIIASSAIFYPELEPDTGGCRLLVDETYTIPFYTKVNIFMDDTENNDEIYYKYNFTLIMSNGTEYIKSGESTHTSGDINDTISYDEDNDGTPDLFKRIYIYAYSSDCDTLNAVVKAWNATANKWVYLVGGSLVGNIFKQGAGRIDAYNATHATIVPDPAILDMGLVCYSGVLKYNITLYNLDTSDHSLTFDVKASSIENSSDFSKYFYVNETSAIVPAGGSINVTFIANLTDLSYQDYEGIIRIYSNTQEVAHIVFAVFKLLNLTIYKLDYNGNPESSQITIVKNYTRYNSLYYRLSSNTYWTDSNGRLSLLLPEGVYHIASMDIHDGSIYYIVKTMDLHSNTTVILDERETYRVKFVKPSKTLLIEKSYNTFLPRRVEYPWGIYFSEVDVSALLYYPISIYEYINNTYPSSITYSYYDEKYANPTDPDLILSPQIMLPFKYMSKVDKDINIEPELDVKLDIEYRTFATPKVSVGSAYHRNVYGYLYKEYWIWLGSWQIRWRLNAPRKITAYLTSSQANGVDSEFWTYSNLEETMPNIHLDNWWYDIWYYLNSGASDRLTFAMAPETVRGDLYLEIGNTNITYLDGFFDVMDAKCLAWYWRCCDLNHHLRVYVNGTLLTETYDDDPRIWFGYWSNISMPVDLKVIDTLSRPHTMGTYMEYKVVYNNLFYDAGSEYDWLLPRPSSNDILFNVEHMDMNNTVIAFTDYHMWVKVRNESSIVDSWLEYSYVGTSLNDKLDGNITGRDGDYTIIEFTLPPPLTESFINIRINITEGSTYYCSNKTYELYVERAFNVKPIEYSLKDFPKPFVSQDGVTDVMLVVGASDPRGPCNGAHTIDVAAGMYVAYTLGREAQEGVPRIWLDWQVTSYNSTHVRGFTKSGNIITFGGPVVNLITKYYHDLSYSGAQILAAYMDVDAGGYYIYSTATGNKYHMVNDYGQGKPVTDYAMIVFHYDSSDGRYVLIVAGLSGYSTYEAAKWLSNKPSMSGRAIILRITDNEGDGTIENVEVIETVP